MVELSAQKGFSRTFDEDGPSAVRNDRETAGKQGLRHWSPALDHRECGRTPFARSLPPRIRRSLRRPAPARSPRRFGRLGFDAGADNDASALTLAPCIPAVGCDGPLHFVDRAMVALRRAVATVFRDVVAPRADNDLDWLRDRDDLRLLTRNLAFPAEPIAPGR